MIKRLYIILLSVLVAAPVLAQHTKANKEDGVVFAPRKGQWQVSLVLGGNNNFYKDQEGYSYLIPTIGMTSGSIGLPSGGSPNINGNLNGTLNNNNSNNSGEYDSGYLNQYLQINGFNDNSLVNIVGLQAKYFFADCWNVNFTAGLDISVTPKKDYVEGDYVTVPDMIIPEQKYVSAQATHNWYVSAGVERYFKTSNPRLHPYVGVLAGFQMARLESKEPYTGKVYVEKEDKDELWANGIPTDEEKSDLIDASTDLEVYLPAGKVGQMFAIKGAAVAGIEYSLAYGLVLGLEIQPIAYRYDVIQIAPKGFDKYNLSHHNIKLLDMPVLKLGFRF